MDTFNLKSHNHRFNKKLSKQLNQLSKLDNYHVILAVLQDWGIIFYPDNATLYLFMSLFWDGKTPSPCIVRLRI